ncbi:MAG: hypothetical protein BWY71_01886 [Planctomycetes bacterium ADurb.Bin412]|nr:MAG: hypothetical protein BWY71_01886 [Planctomycetes bacterium ADurb.Bin412]
MLLHILPILLKLPFELLLLLIVFLLQLVLTGLIVLFEFLQFLPAAFLDFLAGGLIFLLHLGQGVIPAFGNIGLYRFKLFPCPGFFGFAFFVDLLDPAIQFVQRQL